MSFYKISVLSLLLIGLIKVNHCSNIDCQNSYSNGKNGFCISSNCCNGIPVNNVCDQNNVCCFGDNSCVQKGCQTISRQNWGALASRNPLIDLAPVSHVFVHHTFDGESCFDLESCSLRLKSLQSYHQLNKKWDDIAWNFIISGNGDIYEGIGWKKQGFHTLNWNNRSIGIAFIGNFNEPTDINSMLDSLDSLLVCGLNSGFIKSDYKLHGHRDTLLTTKCPGDYLYDQLKTQFTSFQSGPI